MRQRLQLIYFVCGYVVPTAGVVLTIIFLVMYGNRFGRRAVAISDGVGGTLRTDGPKEQYIAYFWIAAVAQMVFLISNIFGPCSAYTRFHFLWQLIGVLIDFVYVVLSLQASSEWPPAATTSNPSLRFLLGSCMLFFGQSVLAWGAVRISGFGITVAPKRNPSNIASHVPFGSVFVRLPSSGRGWEGGNGGSDSGSDHDDHDHQGAGDEGLQATLDNVAVFADEEDKLRRLRDIAEANSGMYRSPRAAAPAQLGAHRLHDSAHLS
jgi:hypothetical protein